VEPAREALAYGVACSPAVGRRRVVAPLCTYGVRPRGQARASPCATVGKSKDGHGFAGHARLPLPDGEPVGGSPYVAPVVVEIARQASVAAYLVSICKRHVMRTTIIIIVIIIIIIRNEPALACRGAIRLRLRRALLPLKPPNRTVATG